MMNLWTQGKKNIFVAAHRGFSSKYPENTMEAFVAALELGVDQLELDIRETRDGELVIMHDATVDRTTDGTGAVADMTLSEIKALDAGVKKGERFRGARVPTLFEFMELIKDHPTITVDFEFKVYPTLGNEMRAYGVTDKILRVIDSYGFTDRCVINTWSGRLHEYIVDTYGDKYKLHLYYPAHHMGECRDLYNDGFCVCMFGSDGSFIATPDEFREMEERYGIRCWAGAGVRDGSGVDRAIECGAELITCNNPDEILTLLRERGYHK